MTDTATVIRPVPRWVRLWAILTVTVALLLLFVLGGFVTSFRVGMADRVWPTEPWYLVGKDWNKLEFGFLVEHTHRAAGWIVGLLTSVLALGAWASEPNKRLRWFGLGAIVFLLVAYGQFHRGMMLAYAARMNQVPLDQLPLPVGAGIASLIGVLACLGACAVAVAGGAVGRWTRSVAVVALIAVMIQGLLGGFRVFLDQLFGTQLAAYHGVFAQVVLSLMCAVVVLAAPRRPGDTLPGADRARVGWLAALLPAAVFVQLIWAVWVRHVGSPVAQRLHILTAFVVVALAVWLTVRILATPAGRKQLGFLVYHLLAIIGLQVLLGVEAYMAKFAASGPNARVLPMDRIATPQDAGIRTAHAVVGAALLAAAVVLALRANRRPLTLPTRTETEPANRANPIGEPVAAS